MERVHELVRFGCQGGSSGDANFSALADLLEADGVEAGESGLAEAILDHTMCDPETMEIGVAAFFGRLAWRLSCVIADVAPKGRGDEEAGVALATHFSPKSDNLYGWRGLRFLHRLLGPCRGTGAGKAFAELAELVGPLVTVLCALLSIRSPRADTTTSADVCPTDLKGRVCGPRPVTVGICEVFEALAQHDGSGAMLTVLLRRNLFRKLCAYARQEPLGPAMAVLGSVLGLQRERRRFSTALPCSRDGPRVGPRKVPALGACLKPHTWESALLAEE